MQILDIANLLLCYLADRDMMVSVTPNGNRLNVHILDDTPPEIAQEEIEDWLDRHVSNEVEGIDVAVAPENR